MFSLNGSGTVQSGSVVFGVGDSFSINMNNHRVSVCIGNENSVQLEGSSAVNIQVKMSSDQNNVKINKFRGVFGDRSSEYIVSIGIFPDESGKYGAANYTVDVLPLGPSSS